MILSHAYLASVPEEIYLGNTREIRMGSIFQNVFFGEGACGVDLDCCLIKKGLRDAMGKRVSDDRDDDTLVIKVIQ